MLGEITRGLGRWGRVVAFTLAVTAFLVLKWIVDARAAGAGTVTFEAHEFNMCGARCFADAATPSSFVVSNVEARLPFTVALSEVCFSMTQRHYIFNELDDHGYTSAVHNARPDGPDRCQNDDFGNMVLSRGEYVNRFSFAFSPANQQNGDIEIRGAACLIVTGSDGLGWKSCSTHFDNNSGARFGQSNELHNLMSASDYPVTIVSGDFNIEAEDEGNPHLNNWRADFFEADETSPFVQTMVDDDVKIDYIWVGDYKTTTTSPFTPLAPINSPNPGDHRYLRARYQVSF